MKVLLLRPDRAGDAVKTLPALRALHAREPGLEYHLLASEQNASVFEYEVPFQLHRLPAQWKKMKKGAWLTALYEKGFPREFDTVVNLLCDPSEESDKILKYVVAAKKFSVVSKSKRLEILPLSLPMNSPVKRDESLNIALLLSQAFQVELSPYNFPKAPIFGEEDAREAQEKMGVKTGRWLGFCPFAGPGNRNQSITRWEKFIYRVTGINQFDRYFLFGTPSDYSRLEKLRRQSQRRDITDMCFPTSFRTLGAYLQRLDGVVAVDSGPLHLAQSLEIKSLGILSGGDVDRWFARPNQGDYLVRRGLLNRFPSAFEMLWAFKRWTPLT